MSDVRGEQELQSLAETSVQEIAWTERDEFAQFRRRLRRWYRQTARDLPWRKSRDPYRVWVSEIMLQQTQVATVIPYYERFLAAFPTVRDLATAPEAEVLKLWEGLGYYRRARQLHRAAQFVVEQYGGEFPTDFAQVLALPGIGRYTAGAILSIALDQPHPILEGNTIRLHSRLLAFEGIPTKAADQRILWSFAEQLVSRHQPGELNQALMELGARICTPRQPQCDACPVKQHCRAFAAGTQLEFPRSGKPMQYEDREEIAVVIESDGHFLLRRCGEEDRWAGLWDFCRFPDPLLHGERTAGADTAADQAAVSASVQNSIRRNLHPAFAEFGKSSAEDASSRQRTLFDRQEMDEEDTRHWHTARATAEQLTGLTFEEFTPWLKLKHGVTRYRIQLACFRAIARTSGKQPTNRNGTRRKGMHRESTQSSATLPAVNPPWQWVARKALTDVPLSVTGRKLAAQLLQEAGS